MNTLIVESGESSVSLDVGTQGPAGPPGGDGPPGPEGPAGPIPLWVGETPPPDTSLLWLDTSGDPDPDLFIDGGFHHTSDWDDTLNGGHPDTIFD